MKERPILLRGPMVRAILGGRKTQTRRIIKPQPEFTGSSVPGMEDCYSYTWRGQCGDADHFERDCAPYQPGDRLWVRETWATTHQAGHHTADAFVVYQATDPDWGTMEGWRWRPSIHMPRWASRITLEVTSVWVEELQSISEADAWAEGFPDPDGLNREYGDRARYWFQRLWRSTYGDTSWDADPWVWACEFRRVEGGRP